MDPVSKSDLVSYAPCCYRMGNAVDLGTDSFFTDDDMSHHMAVLGGTGSGKSKFLERLMRGFMTGRRGFCFIDPHGDTSEDLLAYAAWQKRIEGNNDLFRRIHYLEPSFEMVFGYDPFKFRPLQVIPEEFRESAYEAWLHTKVDRVSEIIQRKQGQMGFEGMPRLQRMLRNVLYATGRAVDKRGRHLPLADALVLLDLEHQRHAEVFGRVAPFLDRDILSDFEILHGFKRIEDLRRETESTVNRLRSLLGPVVRGIFSDTMNTIDFSSIIQNGEILLVNLRETDYFSADQANAIGGLFIHEILTTTANTQRRLRKDFSLVVDEVGEFIGQDLLRALGTVRKYKLSLILAGQDLSTFQKGELDLSQKVLSQSGTVVCFQQTYKKDLETLADRLGRGNLCFDELYQVMDRPDGYDLLDMQDYSGSFTWQDSWNEGGAVNKTSTKTETISAQQAHQETWSRADAHQEGRGHVDSTSASVSHADGRSRTDSPILKNGHPIDTVPVLSQNAVDGRNTQDGHADSETFSDTSTNSRGGGLTRSGGVANADGSSLGITDNFGSSGSLGGSLSVSRRKQVIQKTREEWHPTGRFRMGIADQFEIMMFQIYCLRTAQAIVKLKSQNQSFAMQVATVHEMWHADNKFGQIEKMKTELYALRTYFAPLRTGNVWQGERIDQYLEKGDSEFEKRAGEDWQNDQRRINIDTPVGEKNPFENEE